MVLPTEFPQQCLRCFFIHLLGEETGLRGLATLVQHRSGLEIILCLTQP
jgi:hypothetical protein